MKNKRLFKSPFLFLIPILSVFLINCLSHADNGKEEKRKQENEEFQKRFEWWPTDAQPGPVKDSEKGGYWWWPAQPGQKTPWGNRGYIYVYKIIFDYKAEELPPPKPQELRPSLVIKKVIKNVKIYFDYNKDVLRDDAVKILISAAGTLKRNPGSTILISGNCDLRGSEAYNDKLGRQRAESVKKFMLEKGIAEERIRMISRGKLDAIAPITDIVGMQKDRNAQFMVAEVEEVMMSYSGAPEVSPEISGEASGEVSTANQAGEGKVQIEEKQLEGDIKVSTKEYTVRKGDTLEKIAKKELGSSRRWKYLYEFNKNRIKGPDKLRAGQKILIPTE